MSTISAICFLIIFQLNSYPKENPLRVRGIHTFQILNVEETIAPQNIVEEGGNALLWF